jgi:lipoyl(octanoyl) transferase
MGWANCRNRAPPGYGPFVLPAGVRILPYAAVEMDDRPLVATWLGHVPYREAWAHQKELVARRAAGETGDRLLLLEHPAVLTLGKHGDAAHVVAPEVELERRGIEVIRVERGGEVTYHGPGQLVAYPILRLADRGLLVRPLVRALEAAMIEACAAFGVAAGRRDGEPGCWVAGDGPFHRKIGALGLRIERGVSYHGIAVNVDPDLADFELIDPCGMPGLASTSIARELGHPMADSRAAAAALAARPFAEAFAAAIGARLSWSERAPTEALAASVG